MEHPERCRRVDRLEFPVKVPYAMLTDVQVLDTFVKAIASSGRLGMTREATEKDEGFGAFRQWLCADFDMELWSATASAEEQSTQIEVKP